MNARSGFCIQMPWRIVLVLLFVLHITPQRLFFIVPTAAAEDQRIDDDAANAEQKLPALAVNKDLLSITCWEDYREGAPRIYAQQFSAKGLLIRKNFKIAGFAMTAEQYQPDVAIDDVGHFVMVWVEKADSFKVYARLYAANAVPITEIMQVSEKAISHVTMQPIVAMNGKGAFVVAWKGGDVIGDIYIQRFDNTGHKIGHNVRVNDTTTGVQMRPDVAMHSDGSFIIVWEDGRTVNNYAIYAQRYYGNGAPWGGNVQISHHGSSTRMAAGASVAVQSNRDILVCWHYSEILGQEKIYGCLMNANLQILKQDFVISDGAGIEPVTSNQLPRAVARIGGGYSVTWQGDFGGGSNIYLRFLTGQGEMPDQKRIINQTELNKNKIAVDHGESDIGFILAVWQDDRSGHHDIYGTWLGPMMPLNVHAGSHYKGFVPVSWDPLFGEESITKYDVYRSNGPGSAFVKIASVDLNARGVLGSLMRDYIDSTVTDGQTYYYSIKADILEQNSLSLPAAATPSLTGHTITSAWAKTKPVIDGRIEATEWSGCSPYSISSVRPLPVDDITVRIKNDGDRLYIAVDDPNDATIDPANLLSIIYDRNHNRSWPAKGASDEGLISITYSLTTLTPYWGKYPNQFGADAPISSPPGITAKISTASGHVQYEASFSVPAASGKIMGFALSLNDPGNFYPTQYGCAAIWPAGALWEAAETLGDLVFASAADTVVDLNWSMFNQCRERTSWVKDETILKPPFSYAGDLDLTPYDPIEFSAFGDQLYMGTWGPDFQTRARFAAHDIPSRSLLWAFGIPNSTWNAQMAPAVNDSLVICSGQDAKGLYALDRATGLIKWSNNTGSPTEGHPILDGERIYFHFQSIYCINARNGATIWSQPMSGSSVLTVDDINVYVSMNNHLMAFDKYSGVPRWQVDSQSSRAVAVDMQYIYTFDNSTVVCREKDSGKRRWVYTPPNGARMQDRYNGIAVHHWYLCFTTYENTEKRGQLFTLNLPEGTYRWHFTFDSTGATWPTIANDVVYTCNGWGSQAKPNSKTGAVHGFDLSTGTRIFYDYSKRYIEQPIVANHRLMLICADRIKIFSNSPITGVNIEQDQTPAQYVLRQNYPNPFNASTTIEYELARAGFATLKVYNLLGETVATLFAEYRPAGKGKMVWDTRGLASGLYVYKLEAGDVVQIRKCIVMK